KVKKVKKTIISSRDQTVNFGLYPQRSITPSKVSKITRSTAICSAKGIKNAKSKTSGLKYSSNLNENPTGSFNLMSPLITNNNPTIILAAETTTLITMLYLDF